LTLAFAVRRLGAAALTIVVVVTTRTFPLASTSRCADSFEHPASPTAASNPAINIFMTPL